LLDRYERLEAFTHVMDCELCEVDTLVTVTLLPEIKFVFTPEKVTVLCALAQVTEESIQINKIKRKRSEVEFLFFITIQLVVEVHRGK
jgi:hypothetical protein